MPDTQVCFTLRDFFLSAPCGVYINGSMERGSLQRGLKQNSQWLADAELRMPPLEHTCPLGTFTYGSVTRWKSAGGGGLAREKKGGDEKCGLFLSL